MARLTARRLAWALLVLGVLLAHVAATRWLAERTAGWGAAPSPQRLQVTFVRELRPAAAAAAAPVAKPPRKPRRAAAPAAPAASQPAKATQSPVVDEPAASPLAAASEPEAPRSLSEAPLQQESPTAAAADPASAAASAPATVEWPDQWPASTRLTYRLTGWFRGEVHGDAVVEWLRVGSRYQVHLDVSIGPSFAPFMARRMSSDGDLTPDGLVPRLYEEETRVGLGAPRRVAIRFEPDAVRLADGRPRERPAGVQDAASQFVHLSWLFTTQPQRLVAGRTVELPLALPRSLDLWAYDVLAADDVQVPFASLPVLHLKPRRLTRPRGDLVVEAWFAPTLLYLPVRIRIHQDAETFVDLLIDRPPLQAP